MVDEEGVNQVVDGQSLLADEVAEPGVGTGGVGGVGSGIGRRRTTFWLVSSLGFSGIALSLSAGGGVRRA